MRLARAAFSVRVLQALYSPCHAQIAPVRSDRSGRLAIRSRLNSLTWPAPEHRAHAPRAVLKPNMRGSGRLHPRAHLLHSNVLLNRRIRWDSRLSAGGPRYTPGSRSRRPRRRAPGCSGRWRAGSRPPGNGRAGSPRTRRPASCGCGLVAAAEVDAAVEVGSRRPLRPREAIVRREA